MGFDGAINAYFVTVDDEPPPDDASEMSSALALLRNHIPDENIRHIKPSEGFPLIATGRLSKKDVFIFDKFEGDFFAQLQLTKSLIVGPRCLCSCILNCEPIPLGTSPVYTTAMRNLQISATGIKPLEKEQLRVLIQWMGGHYFQNFGRSITHLISNTIKSTKYEHATLNGIPVMHVDWVQRVWERSCVENVTATAEEFQKYSLPIFFGANITCTGLDKDKKNEVMRVVNENGGTFHRTFRSQLVDILITDKSQINSEKYKAAVRYKKEILTPEWIFHSVEKGFALPTKAYQVKSLKVSTPTKADQSVADFTSHDISNISRISSLGSKTSNVRNNITGSDVTINETQVSNIASAAPATQNSLQRDVLKKASSESNYKKIYDEICPKQAKKAGAFLDGFCIYLSGFRAEEKEKLNRILNAGGATRYDFVNAEITHIIVGQLDDSEFKAWKRDGIFSAVNILRLEWLLESIKLKQPANEAAYRMSLPTTCEPDAPSPSSKKTLRSMNHSFKKPDLPIKKRLFEADISTAPNQAESVSMTAANMMEDDEQHLIAQYSQEHESLPMPLPQPNALNQSVKLHPIASSTQCAPVAQVGSAAVTLNAAGPPKQNLTELTETGMTVDYENLNFFDGLSVYIDQAHFPEEYYSQMIHECEAAQGNIVARTFRDTVDYAIVSFQCTLDETKLPVKARYVITELYIEACLKQNELVPVEYFHKPIPHTADSKPLAGMTIVISLYSALERDFIESIAQLLGAKVNKTFVKKEKPLLVCQSAEGSKYEGAIKWRYPVVTSEWLVQCANNGTKISYKNYLVGNSVEDFPTSLTSGEKNTTNETPPACASAADPEPKEMNPPDHNVPPNNFATPIAVNDDLPELTPLRNKRVSELAGPMRSASNPLANAYGSSPESPHTPTNKPPPAYNFDFMEGIVAEIEDEAEREYLREVIMEMRNNQTPELERIRREACTPINRKIPTPKAIPEFCTTPAFQRRMAEEFDRRWRLPTKKLKPDTPIDEIRKRVLRMTCEALGISVDSDNEQQQQQSSSEKKRKPESAITPFRNSSLTARTIFTCDKSPAEPRRSETFVPSTQTPNGAVQENNNADATEMARQHATLLGKSTINFDKISFEETSVANNSNTSVTKQSIAASSPELKKITEYLKDCESRRQSWKQRSASNSSAGDNMETDVAAHYVQPFESEQFGLGTEEMVGWRDPAEFGLERRKQAVRSMQHHGTPRFSISCSDEETRNDLISRILRLGGEVCENLVNYDPECTHFLCERPNRGEKMLGCISSGKWVLSIKYIEECSAKGVFVDEELYEWGNNRAHNTPKLTSDELIIASAAHRWRKQFAETRENEKQCGVFTGFRAILRISERNLNALKNVIKAGNGEIVEAQSPYRSSMEAQMATHCFVDMKKAPLTHTDYEYLRANGVHVLTQMYINSYLMYGNNADFAKYEIQM